MERFLEQHGDQIQGVLSGYDRLSIRGTLRQLCYQQGIETFLSCHHVKYKDFGAYSQHLSQQLKDHLESLAKKAGRPVEYLQSSKISKEDRAREIMERDQIKEGLVCVLTSVEPCPSVRVTQDQETKRLHVKPGQRKCLFFYLYYVDRDFGLLHIRLQSWLPLSIDVWVNGRSWLACQLDREGIGYQRKDNCFTHIDNLPRAQELMDQLSRKDFRPMLEALAQRVNPLLKKLNLFGYYWGVRSSEFATDVMFKDRATLEKLYPTLLHHAVDHFRSADILRFLERRTSHRFNGEVVTNHSYRIEGVRIKHWVEENSIKMYDKGSVLRVETTVNNQQRFKGHRWMTLDPISQRQVHQGRPYRPLRPVAQEDAAVFAVLLDARFQLKGFRNRDLSQALWTNEQKDDQQRRKVSGRCTRLLRLLRAHHLIGKIPRTRYYRLTPKGHHAMTTALQLRSTDLARLAA